MTSQPSAIITGVTGQDGILLARALTRAGLHVIGTVRPGSASAATLHDVYLRGIEVIEHDVRDVETLECVIRTRSPHLLVNLAGMTSVSACEANPSLCQQVNADAVRDMVATLIGLRDAGHVVPRFLQASSALMFGDVQAGWVDERTPASPTTAYGRAKSQAHAATVRAREQHGLFASCAVLFNHESPLRSDAFVTGKVTRAAAEIAAGQRDRLHLGNLEVSRDWGWAGDYVEAMVSMLLAVKPRDYVIATGVAHSLTDLVERAFAYAGIDDPWDYVDADPTLRRDSEPRTVVGRADLAGQVLHWRPRISFAGMIARMVDVDVTRVRTGVEHDPHYLTDDAGLSAAHRACV
jgi:GDPmannose 4,6-dehydratase